MTDMIETAANIAFQNPVRSAVSTEHIEALFDRVGGGTMGAEAIGMRIGSGLRDRFEGQQMQSLLSPVDHRRNSERPSRVAFTIRACSLLT